MQITPDRRTTARARPDYAAIARTLGPLAFLLLLVAASGAVAPGVLQTDSMLGFLSDAAPVIALVVGGTFPILAGSIDLSVAGIASVTGVLVVVLNPVFGPWTSLAVVLLALAFGAVQGLVHCWLQLPSFIVSLASLSILTGLALLLSNATAEPIPSNDVLVGILGNTVAGLPDTIILLAVVVALLWLLMRFTRFGRDLHALGSGETAALMSGVDVRATRTLIFMISAGCAAMAGLFLVSVTAFSSPTLAGNLLLLSIVGVVLGGTAISGGVGGLFAAVVGGLITAWLRIVTVIVGVAPTAQNIIFGLAALLAVAVTTDRKKLGVIK